MICRAFLSVLAAVAALAFFAGAPAQSVAGIQAKSQQWNAGIEPAFSASRLVYDDDNDSGLQWNDDPDDADRAGGSGSIIHWPPIAYRAIRWPSGPITAHRHPPCAAPPRGPPLV